MPDELFKAAVEFFPPDIVAAAQASERKWGIYASVSLAQWALESAYGRAEPPGSNNPFGIKAVSGQPFVACLTHETINGQYIEVTQNFAKYASVADAFDAHAQLLATSPYYWKARAAKTPQDFAVALTGVYATGTPGRPYGDVLISIMDQSNLYAYDIAPTKKGFAVSVNPKVSMYLNIAYLILAAIGTGALSLSGIVDAQQATQIVAVAGLLAGVLNIVLHADSSSAPGPLAPPDPKIVLDAQAVADLPTGSGPAVVKAAKDKLIASTNAHIP